MEKHLFRIWCVTGILMNELYCCEIKHLQIIFVQIRSHQFGVQLWWYSVWRLEWKKWKKIGSRKIEKFEIKCRHDRAKETFFVVKGTYIKFLIFQHRNKLFNLWWQHYCIENRSILRTIVILNRFGAVFYTKNAVKISVWCVCVSTKCVWHLYAVQSVKMNELVTYGTNFEYSNIGRIRNWRKSISTGFAQRNSWRRNKFY